MPDTLDVLFSPYGLTAEGESYLPHPTQQKLLDWVAEVRAGKSTVPGIPVLYLQHGVDSGGTRGMLAPLMECVFELAGLRVLIGRKDFNDLRLSVMETFFEILPQELLAESDAQEHRYVIKAKGGTSQVFFRELKDVKGLGSQEFGVIYVAEAHEIDVASYRTLKQRCRQQGFPTFILLEGNPPGHGHWLTNLTDPKHPDYDPDITRLTLSSYENKAFMKPGYLTMLEAMPPSWQRRYLMGEVGALTEGTPVYPAFQEPIHVHETKLIPDRPLIRGWDFGYRKAACVWAQQEDSGRLLVHKEWMAIETPEDAFIDGVITRTNLWFGARVARDYGDPAARNRDPHGVSALTRLTQHGIQMSYRQTTYGQRIPLINQRFSQLVGGVPAITINPACQILIEGLMGGYRFPELVEGRDLNAKQEIPAKDGWFDHLADAFSYLMVNLYGQSTPAAVKTIAARRARQRRVQVRRGAVVF